MPAKNAETIRAANLAADFEYVGTRDYTNYAAVPTVRHATRVLTMHPGLLLPPLVFTADVQKLITAYGWHVSVEMNCACCAQHMHALALLWSSFTVAPLY